MKGPQEARDEFPDLMVGIGTFMEGIDENYIVYESFYISFDLFSGCSLTCTRWDGEKKSVLWIGSSSMLIVVME